MGIFNLFGTKTTHEDDVLAVTYLLMWGIANSDEEFHQIMEIVGTALDRSRDKGFINGDTDVLELSIKAHIPEN